MRAWLALRQGSKNGSTRARKAARRCATGSSTQADGQGGLTYPFAEGPTIGGGVEIAPGVMWMRMPLGGSLAFINVWGLKDEGGWTLVDTGMHGPADHRGLAHRRSPARWRASRSCGSSSPTCTPTTSAWPAGSPASSDCRLWITRLEYLMCRAAGRRHRPRGARGRAGVLPRRRLGPGGARQLRHPLRRLRQGACTRCPTATAAWSTARR